MDLSIHAILTSQLKLGRDRASPLPPTYKGRGVILSPDPFRLVSYFACLHRGVCVCVSVCLCVLCFGASVVSPSPLSSFQFTELKDGVALLRLLVRIFPHAVDVRKAKMAERPKCVVYVWSCAVPNCPGARSDTNGVLCS